MHDDVVDLMVFQVRKHPLEFRAVGVAPRLAAVNELGGDERPQPVCLSLVRIALGRDGEAVPRASAICLTSSGDADVRDRGTWCEGVEIVGWELCGDVVVHSDNAGQGTGGKLLVEEARNCTYRARV